MEVMQQQRQLEVEVLTIRLPSNCSDKKDRTLEAEVWAETTNLQMRQKE
jgi:hypothetical protein